MTCLLMVAKAPIAEAQRLLVVAKGAGDRGTAMTRLPAVAKTPVTEVPR